MYGRVVSVGASGTTLVYTSPWPHTTKCGKVRYMHVQTSGWHDQPCKRQLSGCQLRQAQVSGHVDTNRPAHLSLAIF